MSRHDLHLRDDVIPIPQRRSEPDWIDKVKVGRALRDRPASFAFIKYRARSARST